MLAYIYCEPLRSTLTMNLNSAKFRRRSLDKRLGAPFKTAQSLRLLATPKIYPTLMQDADMDTPYDKMV